MKERQEGRRQQLAQQSKKTAVVSSSSTKIASQQAHKYKRRILNEEEYLSTLGAIIKRDYFPTLGKLEAQYEYLTAMERQDYEALRDAAARLTLLQKDLTELEAPNMSLDEFQARYVTEDTADFEDLLDKFNETKKNRFQKIFKTSNQEQQILLLSNSNNSRNTTKGPVTITQANKTRLEKDKDDLHLGILEDHHDDIRYHYWKLVKEYNDDKSIKAHSISGASQIGQVGGKYEFVETPIAAPEFRIPHTPSRETLNHQLLATSEQTTTIFPTNNKNNFSLDRRIKLSKTPAIKRLIKAHTPKVLGGISSAFDIPSTPKRRK